MTATYSDTHRVARDNTPLTLGRALRQLLMWAVVLAVITTVTLATLAQALTGATVAETPSMSTNTEHFQLPQPRMPGEPY
jgi:hypothetical protein